MFNYENRNNNRKKNNEDINLDKKLYPLYWIAYLLALYPVLKFSNKEPIIRKWHKNFGVTIAILTIIGTVYSLYGRVIHIYPYLPVTIRFIDGINAIVNCITYAISIFWISVFGCQDLCKALQYSLEIDKCYKYELIKRSDKMKTKLVKFYFEFIFGQILLLCYYVYDGILWSEAVGFQIYGYYLLRSIQFYCNFILSLLIRYFVLLIKERFHRLNLMIEHYPQDVINTECGQKKNVYVTNSKDLVKVYHLLLEQVNISNDVFGIPMLFLSFCFIVDILNMLLMWIVYSFQDNVEMKGVVFGIDMLILCCFSVVKDLITYLALVSSCDQTAREARCTSFACYKLLYELSKLNNLYDSFTSKEKFSGRHDITLLAIQSSNVSVYFSAAGFFVMDFSTFFTLISFIMSYLVVLIQFNDRL